MLEGRVMNHRSLKQICRACAIGALPLLLAGFTACTSSNTVANGDTDALCDAAERHYRSSHETAFQYYRAAVSRGSIRAMCKLAERLTQEADVSAPDKRKAYAAEAVDVATRGTRMTDADYGWRAGCYVALARLYNDRKYGVYNRSKAIDCARTAACVNPCDFCNNFYSEIAGGPAGPQSPASVAGKRIAFFNGFGEQNYKYASGSVWPIFNRSFNCGNSIDYQEYDKDLIEDGPLLHDKLTYKKTGQRTATVVVVHDADLDSRMADHYTDILTLTFTSPTSGTYTGASYGYHKEYTGNFGTGTFTLR